MTLEILRNFIQSSNLNILYGSGISRPYLSTLGNIEKWLFLVIFLVVLKKKRNFALEYERLKGEDYGIRDKKHSGFDR